MPIDFVAIDFETANSSRDSACALGAAIVKNGVIVERKYSLLNPNVVFEQFCTYIHGITAETVIEAPDFAEIYPAVFQMLDGQHVAAHNASFDLAVLKESCQSRGLLFPQVDSVDTVEMARRAWPGLEKYKLSALAKHFSLPLKHHNAVEDATACAMLIQLACQQQEVDSVPALKKKLAMEPKKPKSEVSAQAE